MPGLQSVSFSKAAPRARLALARTVGNCHRVSPPAAELRPVRRKNVRPMSVLDPWLGVDFASPFLEALGGNTSATQRFGMRRMLIDVIEDDEKFQIKADIPGVNKNDIKVAVDGDALTISVEHSSTHEETSSEAEKDGKPGRILHRQERVHEYDNRVIRMPDSADMEKVDAQSNAGVLTLNIPKKQHEVVKRRTIPVA